jgi:hypothetical protein
MIGLPSGTRIWLAAGITDMRKGFDGLSAVVQTQLHEDPYSGHVFVFRGRRGDRVKLLWWSGDGVCLFRPIGSQALCVSLRDGFANDLSHFHRRLPDIWPLTAQVKYLIIIP